jgi:putative acyl-CoA dehydrogenase
MSVSAADANQPPPFEGRNLYAAHPLLREAVEHEGAGWAHARLDAWGAALGSEQTFALAARANANGPVLQAYDRYGDHVDQVEFDPAWHALMTMATREGEHATPWSQPKPGAQVARAAAYLLHGGVESGTQCPLTMTYAAVPALRPHVDAHAWLGDTWLPRLMAHDYDPRPLPMGEKTAALVGMGMTERQGGSDVRANVTRAEPVGDGAYRLHGQKWFFSVPTADAHLVLAQAPGGLSCFFLPRRREDGSLNGIRVIRLKDKLGNRSNASSEVDFDGAIAWRLGDEGRGVPAIMEMVRHTRLDCVIGSAGLVHGAVAQALHHARYRRTFGKRLIEHDLMRNVLADLVLEDAAASALALRLARAFEAGAGTAESAFARLATPALKYWVCKRAPAAVAESMEVLGGNGYVETFPLARMYREAPLNSIWEGAGNVMCLDVQRAATREPGAVEALMQELDAARGGNATLDDAVRALGSTLAAAPQARDGRRLVSAIAVALSASILVRRGDAALADAYCASRLNGMQSAFGQLDASVDCDTILAKVGGG